MKRVLVAGLIVMGALTLSWAVIAEPVKESAKLAGADGNALLLKSGSVVLKVPDYAAARSKVRELARRYDAQVRGGRTEVNYAGQKHGDMVLQLNASDIDELMNDLRSIGKLYSERVQTVDQTAYAQKLERREALLHQNEAELTDFLRRPRRMRGSDILFVQYRLFQTRVEASNAAQERANLDRAARRGLINVELFEPEPRQALDWHNWHALAVYRAKSSFLYVVRKLVTGLYFVGWFAPFWIPALVALVVIGRWGYRRFRRWWEARCQRPGFGNIT